jgi:hypothetical protein
MGYNSSTVRASYRHVMHEGSMEGMRDIAKCICGIFLAQFHRNSADPIEISSTFHVSKVTLQVSGKGPSFQNMPPCQRDSFLAKVQPWTGAASPRAFLPQRCLSNPFQQRPCLWTLQNGPYCTAGPTCRLVMGHTMHGA